MTGNCVFVHDDVGGKVPPTSSCSPHNSLSNCHSERSEESYTFSRTLLIKFIKNKDRYFYYIYLLV